MRPNALFLTPRYPVPLVGGDRVKAYHLLKILASRYRVTCVSFVEGQKLRPEWKAALTDLGIELHLIPLHPAAAIARVAMTLFSPKPFEVQYYTSPKFQETVTRLAAAQHFDIVLAFFMRTAEYARTVAGVPRILIAEDARIMTQERATAHMSVRPGYIMRLVEREKLRSYEPKILDDFDLTTYVSPVDRDRILQMNPAARTAIVTNGVDIDEFQFHPDQNSRQGIVFAGKLDVLHNTRMAMRVGMEIFPQLKKEFPLLTCTVAGKNPPQAVQLLRQEGVRVTGAVPHVRDFIAPAAVFLHPQEIGAGIQNKVLESMALGTAVVTTPVGIAGISARHGVHVMIGNTNAELIALTRELLKSPERRAELAANARRLIESEYTWDVVATQLESAIASARGVVDAPASVPQEVVQQ